MAKGRLLHNNDIFIYILILALPLITKQNILKYNLTMTWEAGLDGSSNAVKMV